MNEKIEKLFIQAGANEYTLTILKQNTYFNPEKFAELLLDECVGLSYDLFGNDTAASTRIKKHFGLNKKD